MGRTKSKEALEQAHISAFLRVGEFLDETNADLVNQYIDQALCDLQREKVEEDIRSRFDTWGVADITALLAVVRTQTQSLSKVQNANVATKSKKR